MSSLSMVRDADLAKSFESAKTLQSLESLLEEYMKDAKEGRMGRWPYFPKTPTASELALTSYSVSKIGVTGN